MSRSMYTRFNVLTLAALAVLGMVASANAQTGKALYEMHCASCHGNIAQGSNLAPSLIGVPSVKIHFMLDTGRMPAAAINVEQTHRVSSFSSAQIDELTAYVSDLSMTNDRSLPVVVPGDATRGKKLFEENCEHCHGAGGTGGAVGYGTDRVAPTLMQATVFQVAEAIRSGPGIMPQFGPRVLSDQDVNDVARYVNGLQTHQRDPGEMTLANVGPAAEGLVAWVFGMGFLVGLARLLGNRR